MITYIHHDGAIGDVLLSLPCISLIRQDSSFLHIAGQTVPAGLLKETGYADEVSDTGSAFYSSLYSENAGDEAKAFLRRFDRVFVFTARPDTLLLSNIKNVMARTVTVVTIPSHGMRTHAGEFRLRQLGGGERVTPGSLLDIPPAYMEKAAALISDAGYCGGPLIGIHTGSGGKQKCWPLDNYFELLDNLQQDSSPFAIMLAGPAEDASIRDRIKTFVRSNNKSALICDEELLTVAAVLRHCRLYIGNDSGMTHLAATAGTPVIALFGPTEPSVWKPQGNNVHVIAPPNPHRPMSVITVEKVYEKAKGLL